MADPATITLAVKAALAVATDKRTWTAIGTVLAAILTPFILIILVFVSMLSGGAAHNSAAVDLAFHGGTVSGGAPAEYSQHIKDMQSCFSKLDDAIGRLSPKLDDGSIDADRVKAIFYSLYFGADSLNMTDGDYDKFVDCFVSDEQKKDSHTGTAVTILAPITDLDTVYANLSAYLGRAVTQEEKQNADEIYRYITAPQSENSSVIGGAFISPVGSNWCSLVTSDYGYRSNPTASGGEFHTGLDLGVPIGTAVHAATGGTVKSVLYDPNGYGHYVVIDCGDGLCTLYAHCSQIAITSGQRVKQGDLIAYSGSSGRSTGPHLHFEVDVNGKSQNPRNYLP